MYLNKMLLLDILGYLETKCFICTNFTQRSENRLLKANKS